jgi:hypothetical protein
MNEHYRFRLPITPHCYLPLLVVMIPPCSPYTPSIDCAHSFADYVDSPADCDHAFVVYINFFAKCANKSDDCVKTPYD